MDSSFVYRVFPSSNRPLHEHVLSSGSGCCSSVGALSFALMVGHPLTSQKELYISQERCDSKEHFNDMQLVGASYVFKLKLPRPLESRVITWRPVDALTARYLWKDLSTSLCTEVHAPFRRPRASWIADVSMKASKGGPPREGSRTLSRPRHWVEPDGTPTRTSMWYQLWSTGCSRSGIALPALPNSAWELTIVINHIAP